MSKLDKNYKISKNLKGMFTLNPSITKSERKMLMQAELHSMLVAKKKAVSNMPGNEVGEE